MYANRLRRRTDQDLTDNERNMQSNQPLEPNPGSQEEMMQETTLPSTSKGHVSVETWETIKADETFAFFWTIKNYSTLFARNNEITSPKFIGGEEAQHTWVLKVTPKKQCKDAQGNDVQGFRVILVLTKFGSKDRAKSAQATGSAAYVIKARFQITLINIDERLNRHGGSETMALCDFKPYSSWGFDNFLLAELVSSPDKGFLNDDTIKIQCQIWVELGLRHQRVKNIREIRRMESLKLLSSNLGGVLDDTCFADIALSTATETFMAHKAFLAVRSPVFKEILNSKTSPKNTIEIPDFDASVVKAMLEYIYTGQTMSLEENAYDLLQIGEKYGLKALKEDCELILCKQLTNENCCQMLTTAHLYNLQELKTRAIAYINRNKDEVKNTETFARLKKSYPSAFVDLYLAEK